MTVLTAVLNGVPHLGDAIESIRGQTLDAWEYIIVDDASDDRTPEVLATYASQDPRIRPMRREVRGGPYAAANTGLAEARGRYIARLDADDVALPGRLDRQVTFLERFGLGACASHWEKMTADGAPTGDVVRPLGSPLALKYSLCVRQGLAHSSACIERELLLSIGGYREEQTAQDLRLWCELARIDRLGIVPEALLLVRRPGRLTGARAQEQESAARGIIRDHLMALSGQEWTDEEVRALRPGGGGASVAERLRALERWECLWSEDRALGPERRELARLARRLRWALVRSGLRHGAAGDAARALVASALTARSR